MMQRVCTKCNGSRCETTTYAWNGEHYTFADDLQPCEECGGTGAVFRQPPTIEEINDAFWDSQPLGEMGDRKLATQLRVSPSRVRRERKRRGIAACHPPPRIEPGDRTP